MDTQITGVDVDIMDINDILEPTKAIEINDAMDVDVDHDPDEMGADTNPNTMEMGVDEYADTSDYEAYDTADDTADDTANDDTSVSDGSEEVNVGLRRSARIPKPNPRYAFIQTESSDLTYDPHEATVLAWSMLHCRSYGLQKGLREFGQRGKLKQLHDRNIFEPIRIENLSERKRAMAEKRDGRIKGRACANGSNQRSFIDKDEASSPTVATEAVLITGVIDAHENRDVMTLDVPNAFVQTSLPTLVDMLIDCAQVYMKIT